jgi:leucyl-tRNA synthetase
MVDLFSCAIAVPFCVIGRLASRFRKISPRPRPNYSPGRKTRIICPDMPYEPTAIEKKWQKHWQDHKTFRALDPAEAAGMPKAYVLDMFPYPSGAGLHVGHPVGYTATDIVSRFLRMKGCNVLHPMGWDAFGLPAEQFAIKTNTHPRQTTEQNIANFRRQFMMLGFSYDWDREIDTTHPKYYRWTQWIFLQLFNSYFDPDQKKARPIAELVRGLDNERFAVGPDGSIQPVPNDQRTMEAITGTPFGSEIARRWKDISADEQRDVLDGQRLAFMDEAPVNWCPALGTVLANEEVIDGKSEVGGYPVERKPMRQWMLRITAYADRLLDDLDALDWPESLKEMQRNWIGKSVGAEVDFDVDGHDEEAITVFTTRPDTLYGATYMVLAPEHSLVDEITTPEQTAAINAYRNSVAGKSERDRMADTREKTGVFTGAYAINPLNDQRIPIWISDYVLASYGTGAIMAVPAHDQRDFEFAKKFGLPIKTVVRPVQGEAPTDRAFEEEGIAVNSILIDGLPTAKARSQIIDFLEAEEVGIKSVRYKLRDWLFSRQRYWGEPFPIVLDAMGNAYALPESDLPVTLPEMEDFKPTGTPEPPLSKARNWVNVKTDQGEFTRETNTMPQWAGSCWYYLRYLDPHNDKQLVDPAKERYWMPVDLYVGGVEHAVLHLLYSRFWHKVLFDLGHVSTPEPFARLVNQGLMLGEMEYHVFAGDDGRKVSATELRDIDEEAAPEGTQLIGFEKSTGRKLIGRRLAEDQVEKHGDGFRLKSDPAIRVDARSFKMSKSRGNVVTPDQIVAEYGADTFRLYEMYMGPLEAQKPWNTRDIVGMWRFLQGVWRIMIDDNGAVRLGDGPIPPEIDRRMNRAIKKVADDLAALRFNTAIAELIELKNEMTNVKSVPRELAENFTLMLSPFAPHMAEEIWERLGHHKSLAHRPWPTVDESKLVEQTMEIPVQVNGKLRGKVTVPSGTDEAAVFAAAEAEPAIQGWLKDKTIVKRIYANGKLASFVVR